MENVTQIPKIDFVDNATTKEAFVYSCRYTFVFLAERMAVCKLLCSSLAMVLRGCNSITCYRNKSCFDRPGPRRARLRQQAGRQATGEGREP